MRVDWQRNSVGTSLFQLSDQAESDFRSSPNASNLLHLVPWVDTNPVLFLRKKKKRWKAKENQDFYADID